MKYQWTIRVIGFVILLAGFLLNYIIARRKFNRRNPTGLEGFSSFEKAWSIKFIERFGSLIGKILMLAGIALIVLSFT
jgi:hypothetical protein